MSQRARHCLFDSLYIGVLMLYVLAGVRLVPFHGDESTTIYMSRDWDTLALRHDFQAVYYQAKPATVQVKQDQDLRLLNGTVSRYAIGAAWWLTGLHVGDVNSPWDWSLGWWENLYYGHLPGPLLLFIARMTSALMTALSVGVVFAIARRLAGRAPAWIGAFVYATMPAVLLNGRRAMFEGATLLGLVLVVLAGIVVARHTRVRRRYWLLLGVSSGFALASKHTTVLTIVPVFCLLLLIGWRRAGLAKTIHGLGAAGIVTAGLFMALTPAWWSAPVAMPRAVLDLRQSLMAVQSHEYHNFMSFADRWTVPVPFVFGEPQYYEDTVNDWLVGIGGQISAYEASGLAGIDWFRFGVLVYVALAAGFVGVIRMRRGARLIFLGVAVYTFAAIFATNALPWQRYYLPLSACLAILSGLGIVIGFRALRHLLMRLRPGRPARPVSPAA